MTYFEKLEKLAKMSFEQFMLYINEHRNLYTKEDETEEGNTEIEVTDIDEDFNEELIGRFYFNDDGEFIGSEE